MLNSGERETKAFRALSHTLSTHRMHIRREAPLLEVLDHTQSEDRVPCQFESLTFDLLVESDQKDPIFLVECGSGKDDDKQLKNAACKAAGIPLFRLELKPSRLNIDHDWLVAYLIDLWVCANAFLQAHLGPQGANAGSFVLRASAQERGLRINHRQFKFALDAMHALNRKLKATEISFAPMAHLQSSSITLMQEDGEYACFSSFSTRRRTYFGQFAFGVSTVGCSLGQARAIQRELGELCTALSYNDLCTEIESEASGRSVSWDEESIRRQLGALRLRGFSVIGGFGPKHSQLLDWFTMDRSSRGRAARSEKGARGILGAI